MNPFKDRHHLTVTAARKRPDICTKGQGGARDLAVLMELRHAVFGAETERGFPAPSPPLSSPQLWASLYYLGTSIALLEPFHLTEHLVITVSLTSVNNLSRRRAQMRIWGNQILKNRYQ